MAWDNVADVVALTGAGISTASGIPDFRSPGGVWERFDMNEFHITRFEADPDTFWQRRAALIAAMDYLDAQPNAAHHALAAASHEGLTVVTQNVDGLHRDVAPGQLIEIHGNGRHTICLRCQHREPVEESLGRRSGGAPPCPNGCGPLKPDVVLFGEQVPKMEAASAAVAQAQHLLVIGTSLQVYPAAGLVQQAAAQDIDITICNDSPTPFDALADVRRGPVEQTVPQLFGSITL